MDDIPGITSGFLHELEEQDRVARCVQALGNADTSLTNGVFENQFNIFLWLYFNFPCCTEEKSLLHNLCNIVTTCCSPGYDPERGCMTGMCEKILHDIFNWMQDTGDTPSLFWMHGLTGSGKSAIASTAAQWLDEQKCLCASFVCKRDDPNLQDLRLVVYGSTDREYLTNFQKWEYTQEARRKKEREWLEKLEKLELQRQVGLCVASSFLMWVFSGASARAGIWPEGTKTVAVCARMCR